MRIFVAVSAVALLAAPSVANASEQPNLRQSTRQPAAWQVGIVSGLSLRPRSARDGTDVGVIGGLSAGWTKYLATERLRLRVETTLTTDTIRGSENVGAVDVSTQQSSLLVLAGTGLALLRLRSIELGIESLIGLGARHTHVRIRVDNHSTAAMDIVPVAACMLGGYVELHALRLGIRAAREWPSTRSASVGMTAQYRF